MRSPPPPSPPATRVPRSCTAVLFHFCLNDPLPFLPFLSLSLSLSLCLFPSPPLSLFALSIDLHNNTYLLSQRISSGGPSKKAIINSASASTIDSASAIVRCAPVVIRVRVNSNQSLVVNTISEHGDWSLEAPAARCHEHSPLCSP